MEERVAAVAGPPSGARAPSSGPGRHPTGSGEFACELITWLHQEPRPRLLVNSDGEVLWMSRAAEALSPAFPLAASDAGQAGAPRRLAPAIATRLATFDDERPHCLAPGAIPDWVIWAQAIHTEEDHPPGGPTLIGLTLRRRGEPPELDALAETCRLTCAEVRIVAALMTGRDTATVARELGISIHTLRTHVRHVYRKLGVTTREGLFAGALTYMHP